MLQKALHNAVNHNGVHQFDVQLSGTSNEIHLTVSDCGKGFDPATAKTGRGLGLNRMQERLKLVKGSLSILSEPRSGTTPRSRSFHYNQGFCTGGRIGIVGSSGKVAKDSHRE